ncbi:hypothetical protein F4824DRAFT_310410 [Ustulina deusta]|nr:hypothetical protein F4824DRAFT_310410 [Ustulina deusta]
MVAHKRTPLGAYNLTKNSRHGFPEKASSQTDARTRNADMGATKNFRRKVMEHADVPLARGRLLASNSGSRSAHTTSNSYGYDSPHPPSPPHPPVPNPPPPNGCQICWW